jgi:hypothetical protein
MRHRNDFGFMIVDENQRHSLDISKEVETALITDDLIMRHYAECKIDNKVRLKQVKNLEDLVRFNIKTVADKMAEQGIVNKNT